MRQTGIIAALAVAAVTIATPSQAQDRKVNVNIGGGFTFATGEVHDRPRQRRELHHRHDLQPHAEHRHSGRVRLQSVRAEECPGAVLSD